MFSLRGFIKKGLLDAVGKMSDYQVILNSAGWMDKGVLTEEDLAEINTAIEQQYVVPEEPAAPELPENTETLEPSEETQATEAETVVQEAAE